jgi:hypothetical protein
VSREMGLGGEESASHEWDGGLKKNPQVEAKRTVLVGSYLASSSDVAYPKMVRFMAVNGC